jgi:hypothetical protein
MADKNDKNDKLSPLAALERKHVEDMAERAAAIEAAQKDVRDAEEMLREAKRRLAELQQQKLAASFAFDAARAELVAAEKAKAA